jgi:hypothetical protein
LEDGTTIEPTQSPQIEHTTWVTGGDGALGPAVLGTTEGSLMVLYPTANPVVEYRVDVSYGGC